MRLWWIGALLVVVIAAGCLSNQKTYICPDGAEVLNQIDCQVHQLPNSQQARGALEAAAITPTPFVPAVCPFECCVGQREYINKECSQDYSCQVNKCVAIDTDGDGLFDFEERQLGTNLNSVDSDSDTLSDFIEIREKKTNPLLANTDGDRYADDRDPNPTEVNSARIKVTRIGNVTRETNTAAFLIAAATCYLTACTLEPILAALAPNEWIYKSTWNFRVENTGNDYTNYYSADFTVYAIDKTYNSREEIEADPNLIKRQIGERESFSIGRLEAGQFTTRSFSRVTTISDIPKELMDAIVKQKGGTYGAIENEKYEKYS